MSKLINHIPTNADIEAAERELLRQPQIPIPTNHVFAPGIYCRYITAPAGTCLVGHAHNQESLNLVLSGAALVMAGGKPQLMRAPFIFKSGKGARKMALVLEELTWANVHPNHDDSTDIPELEARFITKSDGFLEHEREEAGKLLMAAAQLQLEVAQ